MNIAMLIIGAAIYALTKFEAIRQKQKLKFSIGFWIKDNWIKALTTGLMLTALYIGRESITRPFNLNTMDGCFFAGLCGHGIVTLIMSKIPVKG